MRILLVSPRRPNNPSEQEIEAFFHGQGLLSQNDLYVGAGLGLLIVAALTPADIEVAYIDDNLSPIDYDGPWDLVALSAMTAQALRAYEIAGSFRARGVKVIMGGMHASLLPEEAALYVDSVAVGEAEVVWPEVLADLRAGQLKPLYRAASVATSTPIPRYELLGDRAGAVSWISTTRGCPFSCSFCCSSRIFGSKYRFKPIDQVISEVEEILRLAAPRKPRVICFADDNMFVDRSRARELAERLRPYRIRWFAQTDLSLADDPALVALLREAGCVMLFIGFESLGADKLRGLGNQLKASSVPRYRQVIQTIHEQGITVMGAFILGLDEDTPAVFDETIAFITENHLVAVQLTVLTPLPGTALRERLEREGRLLPADWSHYTLTEVNFLPRYLPVEKLSEGLLRVYRESLNARTLWESKRYHLRLLLSRRQAQSARS